GLVAWEPGHGHPVGYAQVTREESATHPSTWALEYVVDPHHRRPDLGIARTLLDAALGVVAEAGGGHVHLWVPKPTEAHDQLAGDPGFQGLGLGRALVLAGLDHLAGRGLEMAMLYVDADNASALRLYEKLGFATDHVDQAYVGDVDAG